MGNGERKVVCCGGILVLEMDIGRGLEKTIIVARLCFLN
jgi:hypothetical protein